MTTTDANVSMMQEPFFRQKCETCKIGMYDVPSPVQEWHLECDECGAILFCYVPLPHQIRFHSDPAKFKLFAGGFGSGKTTTTVAEMIDHQLETPNGTSLMGAATLPQLEQTSMKQWFEMMPKRFIKSYQKQKGIVDLQNGHRVIFRPLDDPGKARSLNLSAFHIEEASEVNYEYFVQLTTRLRNTTTDQHLGILSTNPDIGWVKDEFLMRSTIHNSDTYYHQDKHDINSSYSSHISATHLNTYLPPTYYEDTAAGKEDWWIQRFLEGSFVNRQGLVYPMAQDHIVPPFEIPKHWERIGGVDFGIADPTVLIMGAIDPLRGIVYLYEEHYENQKPVNYHAEKMLKMINHIPSTRLIGLIADPSGKAKNKKDMRSTFDHYAEYGLYFKDGINKIEDGIMKVYTYFSLGKIKIFDNMYSTVRELKRYKYPERDLDSNKNAPDKPMDKDNHSCFIAGTLIETKKGLVPIEKVKIGDLAKTRNGFKRVIDSAKTGENVKVKKVTFSNGNSIIATGNHPVYVENKGFLAIDSLRYYDTIRVSDTWEELQCQKSKLKNGIVKSGEGILTQNTQVIDGTSKTKQSGYTEQNGRLITERFRKATTSITKIITPATIISKIWNWWKQKNIYATMQRSKTWILSFWKNEGKTLRRLDQNQLTGINQKKEERGIKFTLGKSRRIWKKRVTSVLNVTKILAKSLSEPISSVPITVGQSGGETRDLMMRNENVLFAKMYSPSISIEKQRLVQRNVLENYLQNDCTTENANNVLVNLEEQECKNTVQVNVRCDQEEIKEQTTNKESVLSVNNHTQQEKTVNQAHVPDSVVISIENISTLHDVYNLTVEEDHEYFANSVLVSNCDSLRYMINELPDDPTQLQNPSVGYHAVHSYGSIQHDHIPHELQDNEEESTTNWLNYY